MKRRHREIIRLIVQATIIALIAFAIIVLISPARPTKEPQEAPTRAESDTSNRTLYEVKKIAQIEKKEPGYTEEELHLLAHVIAGEARGCDDTEQRYVGSVVLNRIEHPLFPDTMEEVVSQPNQYACYRDGAWTHAAQDPPERCVENARYVLENGSVLPKNVVFQAQFTQGDGIYTQTKWHYYCYTDK